MGASGNEAFPLLINGEWAGLAAVSKAWLARYPDDPVPKRLLLFAGAFLLPFPFSTKEGNEFYEQISRASDVSSVRTWLNSFPTEQRSCPFVEAFTCVLDSFSDPGGSTARLHTVAGRNPERAELWHMLGVAWGGEPAIEHLSTAISIAPDFASAYYYRAVSYLHLGRCSEAKADLIRAQELAPDSVSTHYHLGMLYESYGRLEQANKHLRKVIDIEADSEFAQTASSIVGSSHIVRRLKWLMGWYRIG